MVYMYTNFDIKPLLRVIEDGEEIMRLIEQSVNARQIASSRPKPSSSQLRQYLNANVLFLMVATARTATADEQAPLVGYSIHYKVPSSQFGQVLVLDDLYVRPTFRRQGIGSQAISELDKLSRKLLMCQALQCTVRSTNEDAIAFFKKRTQPFDGRTEMVCWRIEDTGYGNVIQTVPDLPGIKLSVSSVTDDTERHYLRLFEYWRSFEADEPWIPVHLKKPGIANFVRMLRTLGLRIICAQCVRDNSVVGILLFHACGISIWTGPYITIDSIRVRRTQRRRGIGKKMVAKMIEIAKELDRSQIIGWARADEDSDAFFNSIGATNVTQMEELALYNI